MYLQLLSLQLLSIQLRSIFFAFSFSKLSKLWNQKKVCFPLHSKKDFCIRACSLIIWGKIFFLYL